MMKKMKDPWKRAVQNFVKGLKVLFYDVCLGFKTRSSWKLIFSYKSMDQRIEQLRNLLRSKLEILETLPQSEQIRQLEEMLNLQRYYNNCREEMYHVQHLIF